MEKFLAIAVFVLNSINMILLIVTMLIEAGIIH
uniref:Uncharacterized protein n=1 Tax=Siphoviridae sp. cto6l14 TaxID=2827590 RepID=A0A8S5LPG1_9CAUD|nr:MAG TPA: hypothetical protein [Siphoviridae sp. cto6l14]